MEIRRDLYLNKLIKRKNNGLIKVITGIRYCGKSYLLKNLFYNHLIESGVDADHIICFDFYSGADLYLIGERHHSPIEKHRVDPEKFMTYIRSKVIDEGMYYLLLDEIEELDCFEAVLNGYLRKDNMDVYVTGNFDKLLSKGVVTQFAGRGDVVHMYPLSFAEFMTIYKGDQYAGLEEYMLYGGIPWVVLCENENEKVSVLQFLLNVVYLRHITKRFQVKNKEELGELLNIISSSIGLLTNPEKLKNIIKSEKKYIDYFEDSFLIEAAQRYDIKGKVYKETPKKYYFSDLGLRNSRINFRQLVPNYCMENVIYNELRMRGFNIDVGFIATSEKNQEGKVVRKQLEVDFVCNLGSSRFYIQSVYSLPDETERSKIIRPFRKIDDSFKKIIITKDIVQPYYDDYGILTVNIYDFLLDPEIIHR